MKKKQLEQKEGSKERLKGIEIKTTADDEIISFKFRCCVGRDEQNKQIWRTATVSKDDARIADLTPANLLKKLQEIKKTWDDEQKADFERTHSKEDKAKISFSDFVHNRWWTDHVMDGTHTPSSVSFYRYMSEDLVSYFGKKRLNSIDAEAVKRYIKYLNTEAVSKNGEPLAPTTIQHHFGTLRNIMQYARRFHYIQADPCQDLSQKEKPHRGKKKVDFLEPAQAQRFMQAMAEDHSKAIKRLESLGADADKDERDRAQGEYRKSLYWQCLMNVLITTGLRRGECVGLQWGDIDGEKLTLSISRNVSVDKESPEKYHIGNTKTGEDRVVPISLRLYGMLMSLKKEQEAARNAKLMPSAFVFCSEVNPYAPLYPTTVTRHVSKFIKRHNLPNVSPHDLRHTAATLALESGADLKQVQELLGHKDASTTMQFYAGVTDEAKRRTVEGIESLISNGS